MYKKYLVACFLAALPLSAVAENEDMYIMVGVGSSDISNNTNLKDTVDIAKSNGNANETSIGMDVIGIYWPHKSKQELIWGGAIHCDAQFLGNSSSSALDISTLNYTVALSSMYFPSKEHGKGVYVRGDVGLARNMVITDGSDKIDEKLGVGALVGIGYGFPVSSGSRVLVGGNYSTSKVRGGEYNAMSIIIAGLW